MLSPDQFWKLRGTDAGLGGAKIDKIADLLYSREPEFMGRLEASARESGIHQEVWTTVNEYGHHEIRGGHHRAAVAYRVGVPIPITRSSRGQLPDPAWTRNPKEQHARDTQGD
jgi:hypothetical protein